MSPPYLPICGIYPSFQVNLHVPNSKPSNDNLFCMPESLMWRLGAVRVFHARWVILTMSGLCSSFMRKWLVTGMPSPMLKSNQNIIANKAPPGLLLVGQYPLFRTSRGVCLLVVGEYKLYHSVWEPPIMYVGWKISRSLGCYVDNESMPLKILFISVSKTRALAPLQISASLCEGPTYLLLLLSHHPLIKSTS